MIIENEFNENGENLQQIIEKFLIEFYYEFYELEML